MKYSICFILILLLSNCSNDNCLKNISFKIDYHLFSNKEIRGQSYCDVVNKAFRGNKQSIKELSKAKLYGFASYQHGAVLLELINKIGEGNYIKAIQGINKKERVYIIYKLRAGTEFSPNKKFKNKSVENVFPKVHKYLNQDL